MPDSTLIVQLMALVLFAACVFHSWVNEGHRAAEQWFIIGYLFALLFVNFLVTTGQVLYAPEMPVIGAAPSLTIMLLPGILYLAYLIARGVLDPENLRGMTYFMFLLTPVMMLPLDATALYFRWWSFPSDSLSFLNGVPFYLPFGWAVVGAGFYYVVGRIRKIRFRGSGQLFAMVLAVPLLALLAIVAIAVVQLLIDALAVVGGDTLLYAMLALLFLALPLAFAFNMPGTQRS